MLETRNENNRKISEGVVDKYARDMENGDWCLTHQGIAIDVNGQLLDGQHRLAAVVKAKKNILMMVTVGVPLSFNNNGHKTDTFACIDGVRPRGANVVLEILHYKNCTVVSSAVRAIGIMVTGDTTCKVTAPMTERIVRFCSPSIERIAELSRGSRILNLRSGVLAPISIYHTVHPELAEAFLIETQMVNGPKGAPSRALATWLSHHPATGGSAQQAAIYITCSALFHSSNKASVEKLYGSDDSVKWLCQTNATLTKRIKDIVS